MIDDKSTVNFLLVYSSENLNDFEELELEQFFESIIKNTKHLNRKKLPDDVEMNLNSQGFLQRRSNPDNRPYIFFI